MIIAVLVTIAMRMLFRRDGHVETFCLFVENKQVRVALPQFFRRFMVMLILPVGRD